MWAIEVKGIDVETIPKWEEKELLKWVLKLLYWWYFLCYIQTV